MHIMTFENFKEIVMLVLAPLSALGGVWLSSYLGSRNRKENFIAKEIMLKKLEHYERLFSLMSSADEEVSHLYDLARKAKTKAELTKIPDTLFHAGLTIAQYTDNHRLYLDQDVAMHIIATFLGPSEVYELNPESKGYTTKIKESETHYREQYYQGVELIADYAGFNRLEKTYKKINKPTATSPLIDYANEIRKQSKHSK